MPDRIVLDAAGGGIGGAARWATELDAFLVRTRARVTVLGRQHRLTLIWLLHRERRAAGAELAVAVNNASFAFAGQRRLVVLRNALYFLHRSEEHLLARMPRSLHAQIPVVRRLLTRADTIVVPSAAMAERVRHRVPAVRDRIVVRPHPVTPVGPRRPDGRPFILVPVLPAPYKNLVPELAGLLGTLDRTGQPIEVRATMDPADLPAALVRHPRLRLVGTLPHRVLARMWQRATAAFFPSAVEAFGYPLAEARVYGVPVLAPDSAQAREIAGAALLPYLPSHPGSLAAVVARIHDPVPAEPHAFDRDAYFRWLFALPSPHPLTASWERHGTAS